MKTISLGQVLNASFKQFQLLPVLSAGAATMPVATAHLPVRRWPARNHKTTSERQKSPSRSATRLPMPSAEVSWSERGLMALLGLNAVICLGQALAVVMAWSGTWSGFEQWLSRVLG